MMFGYRQLLSRRLPLGASAVAVSLLLASIGLAQPPSAPANETGPDKTPPRSFEATTDADLDFIEGLLEDGEAADQRSFVYDAGNRRDPFVSLLVVTDRVDNPQGPRPEGISGLLIDELVLTGIWIYPEGPVAQFQPSGDPKSVLLRAGDRLYDGEVLEISFDRERGGRVVFRQISNDPSLAKPFREVTRSLQP